MHRILNLAAPLLLFAAAVPAVAQIELPSFGEAVEVNVVNLTVYVTRGGEPVTDLGREDFEVFERAVRQVPEIVECLATGGGIDYLLKIVSPDIDAYQRLIDELLTANIGIDRYFTYVVTRTVKSAAQAPVELYTRHG